MAIVGQAVDNGNGAVFCEIFDLLLFKGSYHNAVKIAGENPCGILNGFASAYLKIA